MVGSQVNTTFRTWPKMTDFESLLVKRLKAKADLKLFSMSAPNYKLTEVDYMFERAVVYVYNTIRSLNIWFSLLYKGS